MLGLGLFLETKPSASGAVVPFTVVDAEGWKTTVAVPSDLSMTPASISRQGFTNTGTTTSYTDTLYLTKRVRQPYPNQASFTADQVALSDYIYSTDSASGATNNSVEISPKPVAHWVMTDRRIVGNSLVLEIVAFHRNVRNQAPVACVEFRATDGSTTVTSIVSTATVLGGAGDVNAVIGYTATLDITSLSAGTITANAKVYPWIGAAASVRDSADLSNGWEFSPRTYIKNTSLSSAPYIVYVASGGNDTTGAVSTTDATAAASPCLTVHGAINRARTVLGTGAGSLNGLRVRLTAGTWSFTASPTANTNTAEIVIEPATGQTKATVTFNFGAGAFHANLEYIRYRDLAIVRAGVNPIHNKAAGACVIENCTHDNIGNTSATVAGAGGCMLSFVNTTCTNMAGSASIAGATQIVKMMRGVTYTSNGASLNIALEQRCLVGSSFRGAIGDNTAGRSLSGCVVAFNKFSGGASGTGMSHFVSPNPIDGLAIVQNVYEFTSATSAIAIGLSNDSAVADTTHAIMWSNTFAGFDSWGRGNILYNETTADLRTHKLQSPRTSPSGCIGSPPFVLAPHEPSRHTNRHSGHARGHRRALRFRGVSHGGTIHHLPSANPAALPNRGIAWHRTGNPLRRPGLPIRPRAQTPEQSPPLPPKPQPQHCRQQRGSAIPWQAWR